MKMMKFEDIVHCFKMEGNWGIPKDEYIVSIMGKFVHKVIVQENGRLKICFEDMRAPRCYYPTDEIFHIRSSTTPVPCYNASFNQMIYEDIVSMYCGKNMVVRVPENISICYTPMNINVQTFQYKNGKIIFKGIQKDVVFAICSDDLKKEVFQVTRYPASNEKVFSIEKLFENGVFDEKDGEIIRDTSYDIFEEKGEGRFEKIEADGEKFKVTFDNGKTVTMNKSDRMRVQWITN